MSIFPSAYQNLYKLQDKVFAVLQSRLERFYLTGGTALGRFFLNHRYSDDLDFFIDKTSDFHQSLNDIYFTLRDTFCLNEDLTLRTDTYVRIWISEPSPLKIDFVNEVPERWGDFHIYKGINIDNPANILSNKLGAVISRDEPKDIYDIISLAGTYSFNWLEVYRYAARKQLIDETDFAMRLSSFPVEWLEGKNWLKQPVSLSQVKDKLETIADDFLLGKENSLGLNKPCITSATLLSDP